MFPVFGCNVRFLITKVFPAIHILHYKLLQLIRGCSVVFRRFQALLFSLPVKCYPYKLFLWAWWDGQEQDITIALVNELLLITRNLELVNVLTPLIQYTSLNWITAKFVFLLNGSFVKTPYLSMCAHTGFPTAISFKQRLLFLILSPKLVDKLSLWCLSSTYLRAYIYNFIDRHRGVIFKYNFLYDNFTQFSRNARFSNIQSTSFSVIHIRVHLWLELCSLYLLSS